MYDLFDFIKCLFKWQTRVSKLESLLNDCEYIHVPKQNKGKLNLNCNEFKWKPLNIDQLSKAYKCKHKIDLAYDLIIKYVQNNDAKFKTKLATKSKGHWFSRYLFFSD